MSEKQKFPYAVANELATRLALTMAGVCDRLIVAGSIRRLKPEVGDIEFVYVPKKETRPDSGDMFASNSVDLADEKLFGLINSGVLAMRKNVKGQTTWGDQIKLARHVETGIPIDFFPIPEASWWNYVVCRTGPKESNVAICMAAEKRGLQWKPYTAGFMDVATMQIIPVFSECEVFEKVGLPYYEPKDR